MTILTRGVGANLASAGDRVTVCTQAGSLTPRASRGLPGFTVAKYNPLSKFCSNLINYSKWRRDYE
jgi:hypothetical protein